MNYRSRLTLAFLFFNLVAIGSELGAQTRRPVRSKPRSPITTVTANRADSALRRRIETFDKVWTTLNENYFDRTFSNLDWEKIRTEFSARASRTKTDSELHALLNEMIGRLQKSHLAIIAPEVFQAIERAKVEAKAREASATAAKPAPAGEAEKSELASEVDDPLSEYGIGVDLRILDGKFVITRLDTGSSGSAAGLKTGYAIERVNGVSLPDLLKRIESSSVNAVKIKKYLPFQIVSEFLNGEKDSEVSVTYLDETDAPKEVRIRRQKVRSETITLGTSFPDRQLKFEAYALNQNVGYIRFNLFAMPVIGKFCDALTLLKDKKALVIDLRGNFGGVLASLMAIGGMLTGDTIDFGNSIYRTGTETLVAYSKKKHFNGKLVLLVDRQTVSAAEIFAASLKDAERAVIVGETTSGEALPSIALDLPTGAVLFYPIANYRSPSGRFLEGSGVEPDVTVALTRKDLLAGMDSQLNAGLAALDREPFIKARVAARSSELASVVATVPLKTFQAGAPAPTASSPPPPPPVAVKRIPDAIDPAAKRVLADFVNAVGGAENLQSLTSYELSGKAEILLKGSRNRFDLNVFYQKPGRYSEILNSPAAGEVREVYNGTQHFVQTDYGLMRDLPQFADTGDLDLLAPVRSAADPTYYKSLTFAGVFDRDGRKVAVIDARTKDGYYLAMAFDVETKLMVSFTGSYYSLSFSDYRTSGKLVLPYRIERERVMNIMLENIRLNGKIDDGNFMKKENCFDREN